MSSRPRSIESSKWRHEHEGLVLAGRAHVGELFAFGGVDVEVVAFGGVADDHAFVDFHGRADEEAAAVLEIPEGEAERLAGSHGSHGAGLALLDLAGMRLESDDAAGHDAFAFGIYSESVAIAEKPRVGISKIMRT